MYDAVFDSVIPDLLPFRVPERLQRFLRRATGIGRVEEIYGELRAMDNAAPIAERLLRHLEVSVRVASRDLEHIPRTGPVVVVVNHPFGILEGAALASLLLRVRPDVRFLANGILTAVPELREMVIPVDPFGARSNVRGSRKAVDFLAQGGAVVIFPAGAVSHFQWKERSITDPKWSPAVAKIVALAARRAESLTVVPAYVEGANSVLFQAAGVVHPLLRTLLLGRELLNKRRTAVEVRMGAGIAAGKLLAIPSDEERIEYLRWRTYLLASRNEYKARTAARLQSFRARRADNTSRAGHTLRWPTPQVMDAEVLALAPACLLAESGTLKVYIARAAEIPSVLTEIGRLREITFRAAGEGTGKALDLDRYDSHYLHLFVWNEHAKEVVGAYRLAPVDKVRREFGVAGLYTASLFQYGDEFLDRLGPALELGRSFVRLEYQKAFQPLLLLWKGIGKYVARNPQYRVLFGPVSISNQYQSISRQLMVSFLERNASLKELVHLVSTRNPFRARRLALPKAGFDFEDLSAVIADLEPSQPGVPVLLRQYLKLGGRLLGFNVDPQFADALDGLIVVDLMQTEARLRERYLGKAEAAQFVEFQKGWYGTQQSVRDFELDPARHSRRDPAADFVLQVHRS